MAIIMETFKKCVSNFALFLSHSPLLLRLFFSEILKLFFSIQFDYFWPLITQCAQDIYVRFYLEEWKYWKFQAPPCQEKQVFLLNYFVIPSKRWWWWWFRPLQFYSSTLIEIGFFFYWLIDFQMINQKKTLFLSSMIIRHV